ncbi:MAG: formate dehydrogenase accessory protein FdhE [Chloroflexota bacterium]
MRRRRKRRNPRAENKGSAEIASKYADTIQELRRWEEKAGPSKFIQFHEELLTAQSEAGAGFHPATSTIDAKVAAERLSRGVPLLVLFSYIGTDWPLFSNLSQKSVAILHRYSILPPRAETTLATIAGNINVLRRYAKRWYERGSLPSTPRVSKVASEVLADVIGISMHPFLNAWAGVLSPLIVQEKWRRNYCPVCGGRADFAFLEKEVGNRWLVCSRCDGQWLFLRLKCPFCENQDPKSLSYFTDDSQRYRLYVCDVCRNYVKAIDLRQTEGLSNIPAERILTADLDRQGLDSEYSPGWLTTPPYHQPHRPHKTIST